LSASEFVLSAQADELTTAVGDPLADEIVGWLD
jgi:hypothetical protein